MKTKVEILGPVKQKVTIEIPADEVGKYLDRSYTNIQKKVQLKGFRKGKVPLEVIKKDFKVDAIQDAIEEIVNKYTFEALQENNLNPVSRPGIEIGKFEEEKPFEYNMTFEVRPEIKEPKYDGFKLEKEKVVADEKEIEEHLKYLQNMLTRLEPVADDDVVGDGKAISVDFTGTAGGQKFKGSDAKNFLIDIGGGGVLPEIEKNLIGMKLHEKKSMEFDYPKDYFNKELAGKKAVFEVEVKEIKKKVVPEINDDFAKDAGPFKTLSELKKSIVEKIEQHKDHNEKQKMYRQVIEQLVEKNKIEIPECFVESEVESAVEGLKRDLKAQGKTVEDAKINLDGFKEKVKPEAILRVKGNLILDKVSEIENVQVADEEVEQYLKDVAAKAREGLDKVKKHFNDNKLLGGVKFQIRSQKTLDLIISKSKIKEIKPKKK